jgi:hypothetical protein
VAASLSPQVVGGEEPCPSAPQVAALTSAVSQLESALQRLTEVVDAQSKRLDWLEDEHVKLQERVAVLESTVSDHSYLLEFFSRDDSNLFVTGANLHIRDGSGATWGRDDNPDHPTPSGLGNLILGYNEEPAVLGDDRPTARNGSHNLVIGPGHRYVGVGGLVGGFGNDLLGSYSTICGGFGNIAGGTFSVIGGGAANEASGSFSTVSGGYLNQAGGMYSTISGGTGRTESATAGEGR